MIFGVQPSDFLKRFLVGLQYSSVQFKKVKKMMDV